MLIFYSNSIINKYLMSVNYLLATLTLKKTWKNPNKFKKKPNLKFPVLPTYTVYLNINSNKNKNLGHKSVVRIVFNQFNSCVLLNIEHTPKQYVLFWPILWYRDLQTKRMIRVRLWVDYKNKRNNSVTLAMFSRDSPTISSFVCQMSWQEQWVWNHKF
jgi:hypothetical protein